MLQALRRLVKAEDVLWALWLALLRPAAGELFLEGGVATGYLAGAAGLYWVTGLMAERGGAPRSGALMLMSLGVCTIIVDAGLKQLEAPQEWLLVHAIAVLVLTVVLVVQHLATGGSSWVTLPGRVRRVIAWPMVMAMAEFFGAMMAAFVDTRGAAALIQSDDGAGSIAFMLVLVFGIVMPMVYAFFVVALRCAAYPGESTDPDVWTGRYLWAVAWALIGVFVVTPLLEVVTRWVY